jgi:outer membrane protein
MVRYMRTVGIITLTLCVILGPVAPAFAQAAQAQQQQQTPPPPTTPPPTPPQAPPTKDQTAQQPVAQNQAPPAQVAQPPAPATANHVDDKTPREYSHGVPWFPNVLGPYSPMHIAMPNLTNSATLQQYMKDGKLYLSVQDAITLALQNDLDIAVARYNPLIAETNILSARSGLGTNFTFDPRVSVTGGINHSNTPVGNPFLTGAGTGATSFTQTVDSLNLQYTQSFQTGTSVSVVEQNSHTTSTSGNLFNPLDQSSLTLGITQQLLNGFGFANNRRFIEVAKNSEKISDLAFQQQILTSVTQVETAYWELVYAIQNVVVNQHSVDLAAQLLSDDRKQVEIGTMAPLDAISAEAGLSSANQGLIAAQTLLYQDQINLLTLVTKDPLGPTSSKVEIVPTDTAYNPADVENQPLDQAVREALANRPDYKQSPINLNSDELNIKGNRNLLLPTLSASAQYQASGIGGTSTNSGTPTGAFLASTTPIVTANGTPTGTFVGVPLTTAGTQNVTGFGTVLNSLFSGQFPGYVVQFSLSIPILNRAAQAASASSILTQRQDLTKLQQQQNAIVVDVRTSQINLTQARTALAAATKTRQLQEATVDAEKKKLQLGASTSFLVSQQESLLATAAGSEVRALVNLVEAKIQFDRAMGRTFMINNIQLDAGKQMGPGVFHNSLIPGTRADGSLLADPQR